MKRLRRLTARNCAGVGGGGDGRGHDDLSPIDYNNNYIKLLFDSLVYHTSFSPVTQKY